MSGVFFATGLHITACQHIWLTDPAPAETIRLFTMGAQFPVFKLFTERYPYHLPLLPNNRYVFIRTALPYLYPNLLPLIYEAYGNYFTPIIEQYRSCVAAFSAASL
jgi:hypothetical protein